MSELRPLPPMLDGFRMGEAFSEHSGVRCYPAMSGTSEERYIVKTISVPASQTKLEALLLSGAYPNAEAARAYYLDLAEEIRSEVNILSKLAARRGFLAFLNSDIVPMEEGVGYHIYLLSYYKKTLSRQMQKECLTHLSAVNLGIDLCAALALCRHAGYLYVNLKPDNIFINTAAQAYHLGDLGFISMDSLKYASLPDRYRSDYTAPEVVDAFATLNTTMDTYALGLTLYQIYNDGALPFDSAESKAALMARLAAGEQMPAPAYADEEMTQIILKACAYNPDDRWQTPQELAEALISYMKRNGVNDVPIIPAPEPEVPAEEEVQEETAEETVEETESATEDASEESSEEAEEAAEETADESSEETEQDAPSDEDTAEHTQEETSVEEASVEEAPGEEDWIDQVNAILAEDQNENEISDEDEESTSLREILENQPSDEVPSVDEESISEETAAILSQAQELIEHEAPAPVVAPEPIEIPMPEPIVDEDSSGNADTEETSDETAKTEETNDEDDDEVVEELTPEGSKTWKRLLAAVIVLLLLAAAGFGAYYYYQEYYLQHIDSVTVDGQRDQITVTVVTDMDQSLLTVVCKDTYGNVKYGRLENGQCTFQQLQPGSQYIITLEVEGFHELVNATPASYATPERTQILDMNAITGAEDGAALLTFGVEGPESETWTVTCSAPGEEDKVFTFSGHNYTIVGLTPDVEYTFTLTGEEDIYLVGEPSINFTARAVVFAQNVTLTSIRDNTMTFTWDAPEGAAVDQWTIRCYNEEGYDQILTASGNQATFSGMDPKVSYTLEITADGMTQSSRTVIPANSVIITGATSHTEQFKVGISWAFEGVAPENGWIVLYTVDGGAQQTIRTQEPSLTISPAAPKSHYEFVIQAADATLLANSTVSADVPAASGTFSGYGLNTSNISVNLYKAPSGEWTRKSLKTSTTTFSSDDTIAFVYRASKTYKTSKDKITTIMVLHDSEGRLAGISTRTRTWNDMWDGGYCLDRFSELPDTPGSYKLSVYLNGKLLTIKDITIQ